MRRPSPALVLACVALLVALGGTSYATVLNVPRNSVGTPQLKRNAVKPAKLAPNAVRTAHVLNGSLLATDFKPGQLPQGPKGDRGDRGEKGERGPPGVSGLELVQAIAPTNSNNVKTITASCPGGKKVLGGGGTVVFDEGPAPVVLIGNGPSSPGTDWTLTARELSPTALSWHVYVRAVCATVPE